MCLLGAKASPQRSGYYDMDMRAETDNLRSAVARTWAEAVKRVEGAHPAGRV